jgi:hypothetical protein
MNSQSHCSASIHRRSTVEQKANGGANMDQLSGTNQDQSDF